LKLRIKDFEIKDWSSWFKNVKGFRVRKKVADEGLMD